MNIKLLGQHVAFFFNVIVTVYLSFPKILQMFFFA